MSRMLLKKLASTYAVTPRLAMEMRCTAITRAWLASAWMNLWSALVIAAWARGWAFGRWWLNAAVVGGLGAGTFMTMSRTGWFGFVVAAGAATLFVRYRDHIAWARLLRFLGVAFGVGVVLVAAFWIADRPDVGTDLADAARAMIDGDVTGLYFWGARTGAAGPVASRSSHHLMRK